MLSQHLNATFRLKTGNELCYYESRFLKLMGLIRIYQNRDTGPTVAKTSMLERNPLLEHSCAKCV